MFEMSFFSWNVFYSLGDDDPWKKQRRTESGCRYPRSCHPHDSRFSHRGEKEKTSLQSRIFGVRNRLAQIRSNYTILWLF